MFHVFRTFAKNENIGNHFTNRLNQSHRSTDICRYWPFRAFDFRSVRMKFQWLSIHFWLVAKLYNVNTYYVIIIQKASGKTCILLFWLSFDVCRSIVPKRICLVRIGSIQMRKLNTDLVLKHGIVSTHYHSVTVFTPIFSKITMIKGRKFSA